MKSTILSIIVAVILIGGAVFVSKNNNSQTENSVSANNVSIVDGKQIIEIHAKGGYQPSKSIAKAGIPTILRFDTNGTFDCSASIRIPSLNISKILPQSGSTDIDLGTPSANALQGTCGMGMYPFEVDFQ
ncbi:MAG: cupredoxin domain-containing protein [bacterium]